jgi:hypothetical protein
VTDATLSYRDPAIRKHGKAKGLLEKIVVHQSVINRIASGTDGYAPIVLPADFEIIPPEGRLDETAPQVTTGGDRPASPHKAQADDAPEKSLAPSGGGWKPLAPKAAVAASMEGVWNLVWLRRAAYFTTVFFTVTLLAWPWIAGSDGERLITIPAGADWLQLMVATIGDLIGDLVQWVGGFLPAFTSRWITAWSAAPLAFVINVLAICLCRGASAWLARRISDRSRAIWHGVLPRIPPATSGQSPRGTPAHERGAFQAFRTSYAYQRGLQLVKWALLPNVVGVLMVAVLAWLLAALATQAVAPVLEVRSSFCTGGQGPSSPTMVAELGKKPTAPLFEVANPCNETGLEVRRDVEYSIVLNVSEPWMDGSYPATPEGLGAGRMRWLFGYAAAPFRRVMNLRYLQPVALIRIPRRNEDTVVRLVPLTFAPVAGQPDAFAATFTSPADGELVLFANDAVALYDPASFYANNSGAAYVSLVAQDGGPGTADTQKSFEAK